MRLGYIGWNVSDISAWEELLQSVYGLELRHDTPVDAKYYRVDNIHHRLALYRHASDSIRFIGWEVDTRDELQALSERLRSNGVNVRRGSAAEVEERHVLDMIAFNDPDAFPTEIYCPRPSSDTPFKPSLAIEGFVTGELGLGHIVITCTNLDASVEFYRELLGFRVSDHIQWPGADGEMIRATFLRCNARHHSVALIGECFGLKGGRFNHLMLEAKSLDDVGRAYDVVGKQGYPIAFSLGRHTNDRMTSFYLHTPSGWQIEYGWGGLLVDERRPVETYDATRIWGHQHYAAPPSWKKYSRA